MEKEIDGLEMGVLSDGTAYLSSRGLAQLCGVAPSAIINQGAWWKEGKRDGKLARMLASAGIEKDSLYVEVKGKPGRPTYAYPDDICTVILEYYAFEADRPSIAARENFRKLARTSLKLMIYGATGYDPGSLIPERWRQYHDRLSLNSCPKGHFSVFQEMSTLVLSAIRAGLTVDAGTIPDISVGRAWSDHWEANELDKKYGPRNQHPHTYPPYFPQSEAGPQLAYIYPVEALGEFRIWNENTYLPQKFPRYLESKVKRGQLPASTKDLILDAISDTPELPEGEK